MNRGTTAAYCEVGSWRGPKTLKYRSATVSIPYTRVKLTQKRSAASLATAYGEIGFGACVSTRGNVAAVAVDGRRRRGHDAPDALVAGGEQHVERALDVDGGRRQRVLHRARNGAERALVEDDLDAADGRVHALVRAEVALDDLDVPSELREVRPAAGREVVEHADVVAALEQRLDEVRADEAGAAGDEDALHAAPRRRRGSWRRACPGRSSRSERSAPVECPRDRG